MWGEHAAWRRAIRALNGFLGLCGGAVILLSTLLVMREVIGRYVFNEPLTWSFEGVQYSMIFIAFLTLGYATREKGHVTMELLYVTLPKTVKSIVTIATHVLALAFWIVLTWEILRLFGDYASTGAMTPGTLSFPMNVLVGAMVVGSLAATLQSIVELHDRIYQWVTEGKATYEGA